MPQGYTVIDLSLSVLKWVLSTQALQCSLYVQCCGIRIGGVGICRCDC